MTRKNIISDLLTENRNALRSLHVVFGFDFEKDFGAFRIDGNFTVNKIYKTISGSGFSGDDAVVVLMKNTDSRAWDHDSLYMVSLDHGKVVIDWPRKNIYLFKNHPDYFSIKSSFEDMRKKSSCCCFIVCQKRENMSGDKKPIADLSGRLSVVPYGIIRAADRCGDPWYIGRVNISDEFGRKAEISGFAREGIRTRNINDIIDKSGYLAFAKQKELKRRADALRLDRKKAEYAAADNSGKVAELKELAAARKNEIVKALIAAASSDELEKVVMALGRFSGGLLSALRELEFFEDRTNKKAYSSIDASETAYNRIKAALS